MNPYRQLPSVNDLLAAVPGATTEVVRAALDDARGTIANFKLEQLLQSIRDRMQPQYRRVINATGIVLHTNLGRAPMAETAAQAAYDAAKNYVSLEMDLASGERSSRQNPIRELITQLTGGESATVVNNCAAATVIVLRALAANREVIVSRGQLIEIGGSFRIPDIMAVSSATLREVGTTNITRLSDYRNAIGPHTAAVMRVHTSNYRVTGFTESVGIADLCTLGVPVIDDVGSGAVDYDGEPDVREGLAAGAELVLFSGDKLLGGPQCGIVAGKRKWIEAIERDPFMRAVRCDKMTLAALEATLRLQGDVPVRRMLRMPLPELRARSDAFAERLVSVGFKVDVIDDEAFAGGGSLPGVAFPTVVVAIANDQSASDFATWLRMNGVVARIKDDRVRLDLRTVFDDQELFDVLNQRSHGTSGR